MSYIETICVIHGVAQAINYHQQRMLTTTGCRLPNLSIPSKYSIGRVKCRILYNQTIESIEFIPYSLPTIRSLKLIESNTICYNTKKADRSEINRLYAQRSGCDDILIVRNGCLTDTSFCNIVFEQAGELFTPQSPLLEGTRRALYLDQKRIQAIPIHTKEIFSFDKAYLINAMISLDDLLTIAIKDII